MKKLLISMSIFATIVLIGCEKEFNGTGGTDDPDVPIVQNHTHFYGGGGDVNLYTYGAANVRLKSTFDSIPADSVPADSNTVYNTFRYLKFVSFYSEDYRQRNIHEIEIYSDSVNVVFNPTFRAWMQRWSIYVPDTTGSGAAGGLDWSRYLDARDLWHTDLDVYKIFIEEYYNTTGRENVNVAYHATSIGEFAEFTTDGELYTRWSSRRNESPNDTNYIGFDTVNFVLDLKQVYNVDSIKLYLGRWEQVFDLEVSNDSIDWKLLDPDADIAKAVYFK